MHTPDANGYITVTWPSRNIPHGGIFHTHIANPTEEQQNLLRIQVQESKLSVEQYQKKALALRQKNEDRKKEEQPVCRRPTIRPRTSRRRSLSEIRESGVFDFDKYRPLKRGEDRELMKEKLANTMTYGDTEEQTKVIAPPQKKEIKLPTNKEKWNDLVTQIRERTEWLAEMEYLGQAAPHRDIIKDQIAERMRALDELGIESECGSARSTASGFSTLRSQEEVKKIHSAQSIQKTRNLPAGQKTHSAGSSVHSSVRSDKSMKKQSVRGSMRGAHKEENVTAYGQFTPLQRSPRRRQ